MIRPYLLQAVTRYAGVNQQTAPPGGASELNGHLMYSRQFCRTSARSSSRSKNCGR